MKKGFSMIELIFVIVILGILATVAIPRLAGTTTDAQIAAAAANIRTLISDAAAYYAVKDGFGTGDTSTKWNEITNVSLKLQKAGGTATTTDGIIKIGGKDCIRLRIQNGDDNIPAHILVAKDNTNKNSGACKQVLASAPLKAYFDSRVDGVKNLGADRGAIPIGSIASIYEEPAPVAVAAAAPTPAPAPAPVATPARPAPVAAPAVAAAAPTPAPAPVATPARPAPARPAPAVATATPPPAPAPARPAVAATPPTSAPFIPFVCNNCTQAWGLMNSFSAAAGGPHLPARPQYFSTATNGGQVTHGTGTGSIGLAIPSLLFNKLFGR